jgi:hypothetical protein
VHNLALMSSLSRQGLSGRLRIVVETLEGMRQLAEDMDDPAYRDVSAVVARSGLTNLLFKVGFDEITDPPRYDFVNRWDKHLLMWVIGLRVGRQLSGDVDTYRMAFMPKQRFGSEETLSAIDAQIERARRDLARASGSRRRAGSPAIAASPEPETPGGR